MEIREALEGDIPAIVALLKISLGETLMPKSEEYWRWKHVRNPFGASPVLLCFEGSDLVGVRAFMRWEWTDGKITYRAVRAVDTATHPNHQGKGIFRKLTMALVEKCKVDGVDFVFNTPNGKSMPGYLKMGWVAAGRLPIHVAIHRPLNMMMRKLGASAKTVPVDDGDLRRLLSHPGLPDLIRLNRDRNHSIITNHSVDYLKWRYLDVPVVKYLATIRESKGQLTSFTVGRLKDSSIGTEFRITDGLISDERYEKDFIAQRQQTSRQIAADYCTQSATSASIVSNGITPLRFTMKKGPSVTIRPLALEALDGLNGFAKWTPSSGDLELF